MIRTFAKALAVAVALTVVASAAPASAAPRPFWPWGKSRTQSTDRTPPTVKLTTADYAVIVGAPVDTEHTMIKGTATDAGGVASAKVTVCRGGRDAFGGWSCGGVQAGPVCLAICSVPTTTTCNAARTSCSFAGDVTTVAPGTYMVFACAKDRAGNEGCASPIQVLIV